MTEPGLDGLGLLRLAARSIKPVVPGCAQALRFAESSPGQFRVAHDGARKKAIDLFGARIAEKWEELLADRSASSRAAAMEQLAKLPDDDVRAAVFEELAESASGDHVDVWAATEYLKAIPPTAAASIVEGGEQSLAATIDVVRVLPKDVPPFPPGAHLPGTPYRLESILGAGGFGAVYKAVNQFEQHGEPRALKFCLDPSMILTLQRERELLDRLMASGKKSNWSSRIVKLYGHALDVEMPFLVYEYVAGGALPFCLEVTRRKVGRNLRSDEILGLIRQIAEGLAFAHRMGLVHRDVKPANVLVYRGQTKLADFGIGGVVSGQAVRQSASDYLSMSEMTADGRNSLFRGSGTPLYMSPEQRRGDEPLPHHDIYSLGVMWYQLLTGDITRPLHAGWDDELRSEFDVPDEHVALIHNCVGYHKNRPESAVELLESLPAPLAVQVAAPRQPSPAGHVSELGKQNGAINCVAYSEDGEQLLSGGADGFVRLWDLTPDYEAKLLQGHAGPIMGCAFNENEVITVGVDQTIRSWSRTGGKEHDAFVGHWPGVTCAAFHHSKPWCATADESANVIVWNYRSQELVARLRGHQGPIRSMDFSRDGRRLVSGSDDSTARLWDLENARELFCDRSFAGAVTAVKFMHNGKRIVSCGVALMRLWSSRSGREVLRFDDLLRPVDCAAFTGCDTLLATGSRDGAVRVWELDQGQQQERFEGHANWVTCVATFGKYAVSGGLEGELQMWRLAPTLDEAG